MLYIPGLEVDPAVQFQNASRALMEVVVAYDRPMYYLVLIFWVKRICLVENATDSLNQQCSKLVGMISYILFLY